MSMKKTVCLLLALVLVLSLPACKKKDPNQTIAVTVGTHEVTAAELNYYYVEMVNSFWKEYSYVISAMLDLTKPLNEQIFDQATGQTWADYFLQCSLDNVKSTYALADAAEAAGFTLTKTQTEMVDGVMQTLRQAATAAKLDVDAYMATLFGEGATLDSYQTYYQRNLLADSYYSHYFKSLQYNPNALQTHDAANPGRYDSYTFASYYLAVSKFLPAGKDHTAEQKDAALAACKAAAESVAANTYADVDAFNQALAGLEVLSDQKDVKATEYKEQLCVNLNAVYTAWLQDATRFGGEADLLPATGKDGQVEGYYILRFGSKNDNRFLLKQARHILVVPEGGTYNSITGMYDYSIREMAGAMVEAKDILQLWNDSPKKIEPTFAALADQHSDDRDVVGGLYENIYPGLVSNAFSDWCYAENRKPGDVQIIESEFGCHIMYFIGDSTMTYRDFLITADLQERDTTAWFDILLQQTAMTTLDLSLVELDMVLYNAE